MVKPLYSTDRPRKYLAGRLYKAASELEIFGGGRLRPGTPFSATGHLGSMLYKPCRGRRRPTDLLIEVRRRRPCRQPHVYDTHWIAVRLFDAPGLILRVRRRRKKEEIKRKIRRALDDIRRRALSV